MFSTFPLFVQKFQNFGIFLSKCELCSSLVYKGYLLNLLRTVCLSYPKQKNLKRNRHLNDLQCFHFVPLTGCIFGSLHYNIGDSWNPDIPPFGVMYCVICTCNKVRFDFFQGVLDRASLAWLQL